MYKPIFTISNKILRNIGAIEAAKEVIENAPLVPRFEKQFQSDALVRTIHHGTSLEGNDLTLYQTQKILEGQSIVAKARDIQEIINYRNTITLLDELVHKRGQYDASMLTDLHKTTVFKVVAEEKVGVFRDTQVVIKKEGTEEVVFRPPPPQEVIPNIDDFFSWLNSAKAKEIHPILRAGMAHYVLVAIHPFVEGNGRTVRAFATLVLMRENYNIKNFFSLEEHFDEDPASYYRAFSLVDKQSDNIAQRDLTSWLEYFTEVVAIELVKIKERIRKLSIDTRLKVKIGRQVALSERQMKLVEYVSNTGAAVMKDLRGVLPMVSDDTILRDIKDLLDKNIIRKSGSTKGARYIFNSRDE